MGRGGVSDTGTRRSLAPPARLHSRSARRSPNRLRRPALQDARRHRHLHLSFQTEMRPRRPGRNPRAAPVRLRPRYGPASQGEPDPASPRPHGLSCARRPLHLHRPVDSRRCVLHHAVSAGRVHVARPDRGHPRDVVQGPSRPTPHRSGTSRRGVARAGREGLTASAGGGAGRHGRACAEVSFSDADHRLDVGAPSAPASPPLDLPRRFSPPEHRGPGR